MKTKKREMRTVLTKIYLMTMGIALIIGMTIFNTVNEEAYIRHNKAESIKNCHDFKATLDLILSTPIYITSEIAINEELQTILEKSKSRGDVIESYDEKDIKDIIAKYLSSYDGIRSIHILNKNNYVVSGYLKESQNFYEREVLYDLNIPQIYDSKGKEYIDISKGKGGDSLESSIYISRAIRSKESLEDLGCIVMVLSSEYIRSITKSYLDNMELTALLVSEDGDYFEFDSEKNFLSQYLSMQSDEANNNYTILDYSDKKMQIVGAINEATTDELWGNIIIGVVIVNIIFLIVMILLLGRKIIYPLEKISQEAKSITNAEDLSLRINTTGAYEEIALLGQAINEMLANVENLVNEVKEKERTERRLELSVINHQVNPHFLYNTLNSVGMLVAMEEKEEAQNLIQSLAKYYRACLNQDDLNTVGQEVVILKEYVNIMHIKNSELVRIEYHIDTSLIREKMPRMILQTLVENSIKYGIKTTEEPLKIDVKITRNDKQRCMVISVRDNGAGMNPITRENILKEGSLNNNSGGGFGLKSTIRRISLMSNRCNIKEILEIDSEIDKYTEIRVYIPIIR